jgi:subtilisin family serine protease
MPVRVLDEAGAGSDETIAQAVRWAADNGADVINLSLGESGFISRFTKGGALNRAIRDVTSRGVVVIAAAGNEGTAGQQYRVGVDVLIVNASDRDGQVAAFSNLGDVRAISAPGVDILSTAPTEPTKTWPSGTDGWAALDGTSMAAPLVSGVAALALAAGTPAGDVMDLLVTSSANPDLDPRLGAGVVDAAAAVGTAGTLGGGGEAAPEGSGEVVERVTDVTEQLRGMVGQPLSASCDATGRRLVVEVTSPDVEGRQLVGQLVVAGFTGAGTYPAAGQVTLTVPDADDVMLPISGEAVVADDGSGTLTVPGEQAQPTIAWTC